MKKGDILFCGVGGQGILLASEVTARALLSSGFDVKKSEVHGMAQRGGSVVAHVRFGNKVYSPLISRGGADFLVAFELLESLRYLPYMNTETRVIVNTQKIFPPAVATGDEEYPGGTLEELEKRGLSTYSLDAFGTAQSVGEVRALNMVMTGALSAFLPVEESIFFDVISGKVPERYFHANREAFMEGRKCAREAVLRV